MTSASTVWTHGRWVPYCRGREAATPSPSGTVPEMATAHVRVRSAARATLVACLQGPPPDASEDLTFDHGLAVAVVCVVAARRWHRRGNSGTARRRSEQYAVASPFVTSYPWGAPVRSARGGERGGAAC